MRVSTVVTAFDGSLLRERRKRAGLSQRDLAAFVGISKQGISLLERGLRRPRPATMARIAAVLK